MPTPRRVIVLGSTGSIGVNTLKVIAHLNRLQPGSYEVVGLAAGRRAGDLVAQAQRHGVRTVALADATEAAQVRSALPGARVLAGPDAALQLVQSVEATDLTAAVVGSTGLPAVIAGIEKGLTIGLANKETLVAAGELVTPLVAQHGAQLIPVDSEHSAIFQCLAGQTRDLSALQRIVLTASGGPFRTVDHETMHNATVEQALRHPTWNMGPKITIDSASMMNKALEVIEAHWLFGLPAEKIDVIIHPQSIVHSFVEFTDHSVLAQLGPPDMCTPIQYALTWPQRSAGCSQAMDWSKLSKLDFFPPDHDRFPALRLAYQVIRAGGTAGAIFNAANEAAVAAFLERRIRFGRMVELVAQTLAQIQPVPARSLAVILEADRAARACVEELLTEQVPSR